MQLACVLCEREIEDPRLNRCPDCEGAVDTIYDLGQFDLRAPTTPNVLHRYFSLLPLHRPESAVWLGEGNTPCFEVPDLAEKLGVGRLFFKDESANPTRTTKDRSASVSLSWLAELGISKFALSSTGNSSAAYARAVQLVDGFSLDIFVGREFVDRLDYPDHPAVTTYVVDGDFVSAGAAGQRYAASNGRFWEGGFFNLARREGLKLAYLEAFDAMSVQPDYIFQAVSGGLGLMAAYKGSIEYREVGRLSRLPSLVAVQQESCSPMAHAFAEGAEEISERHIVKEPKGIVRAILRGNPTATYPYVRDLCMQTGGNIVAASEEEIRAARQLLDETLGVRYCFASATAFAGAIKGAQESQLSAESVLLVNLTGADRPGFLVPRRLLEL